MQGVTLLCFATLLLFSEPVLHSPGQHFLSAVCLCDFCPAFSFLSCYSPRTACYQPSQAEVVAKQGLKPAQFPAPLLAQVCCKGNKEWLIRRNNFVCRAYGTRQNSRLETLLVFIYLTYFLMVAVIFYGKDFPICCYIFFFFLFFFFPAESLHNSTVICVACFLESWIGLSHTFLLSSYI